MPRQVKSRFSVHSGSDSVAVNSLARMRPLNQIRGLIITRLKSLTGGTPRERREKPCSGETNNETKEKGGATKAC